MPLPRKGKAHCLRQVASHLQRVARAPGPATGHQQPAGPGRPGPVEIDVFQTAEKHRPVEVEDAERSTQSRGHDDGHGALRSIVVTARRRGPADRLRPRLASRFGGRLTGPLSLLRRPAGNGSHNRQRRCPRCCDEHHRRRRRRLRLRRPLGARNGRR